MMLGLSLALTGQRRGGAAVFAPGGVHSAEPVSPQLPRGTGSGATHPSVVDAGEAWNGYRYWMAYTPYPSEADENPFIVASADGWSWEEPVGISNPVEPEPSDGYWNADTDLTLSPDRTTLRLIWIQTNGTTANVYLSTSTNGVTWAEKNLLFSETRLACPVLLYVNGTYYLYYIIYGATNTSPCNFWRRASADLATWGAPEAVSFTPPAGKEPWHFDVKRDGAFGFILVTSCKTLEASPINSDTFAVAKSTSGTDFGTGVTVMTTATAPLFDSGRLYRPCFIQQSGSRRADMWYSGGGNAGYAAHDVARSVLSFQAGPQALLLDGLTAAPHAAYSLSRYLRQGFVNLPVALIRRSSDDALAYVYPENGALVLDSGTSAASWVGAGTAYIVTLYDQSDTAALTVTQTDASLQPAINFTGLDSKPVIVGNGADYMGTSPRVATTNAIAAVAKLTSATDSAIWGNASGHYAGQNSGVLRLGMGAAFISGSSTTDEWARYVYRAAPGTDASTIRLDGATVVTGTMATQGVSSRQRVMAQEASSTIFRQMQGELAELILWGAPPSDADAQAVEVSFAAHFGL